MKMVKFYLGIELANCSQEEIIEFSDTATEEEIEDIFQDWKNGLIDASWQIQNEQQEVPA